MRIYICGDVTMISRESGKRSCSTHFDYKCDFMFSIDDFRFNAHHLLLDLDATTNHLMMLVVSREVAGSRWDEAVARQKLAYDAWTSILSGVQTDPMPVFDGRPTDRPHTSEN